MLTQNQVPLTQPKRRPRLHSPHPPIALTNTHTLQPLPIPLTKLLRRHPHLQHRDTPLRNLTQPNTPHLPLHRPPLQLIRQLRIIRIDTKHIPRLRLFERLEQRIERLTEFTRYAGRVGRYLIRGT